MFASLAGKYQNTYATCMPDTCTAALLQVNTLMQFILFIIWKKVVKYNFQEQIRYIYSCNSFFQTSLRDQWGEDVVVSVACEGEEEDHFSLPDLGFL